jgi:hypothetical protein
VWGATNRHPCGEENDISRASALYRCEIKHPILFFIIWMGTGGNCLMLHFYECTFCVNGVAGALRAIPASISLFPLSRAPSLCPPVPMDCTGCYCPRVLNALTELSSSLPLYHSEACQTSNRPTCGPGTCLFLAAA